jgi:hypothetical protein
LTRPQVPDIVRASPPGVLAESAHHPSKQRTHANESPGFRE